MHTKHTECHRRCIMIMGNYFRGGNVSRNTMAASTQPVGVDHVTTVPVNFEADDDDDEESTLRS